LVAKKASIASPVAISAAGRHSADGADPLLEQSAPASADGCEESLYCRESL